MRKRWMVSWLLALGLIFLVVNHIQCTYYASEFSIISGSENKTLENLLIRFGRSKNIHIHMKYKGSVDIMHGLQEDGFHYDAVWPANSLWLALGDAHHRVKHDKSIMTSPVVFGIRRSLADELGFIGRDVRVRDILAAAKAGKLKFMMTSATQSNSGASAYMGFLYALLGNPEAMSREDLHTPELKQELRALFSAVNRSSGSSGWLKDLFLKGNYDAMVNYEAVIIEANQELVKSGREPLHVVYPMDGIVLADSPLGYVDQGSRDKETFFKELQAYLLSDKVQQELVAYGRRTGFGGKVRNPSKKVFNPDWGIDIERILSPIKMPNAEVILEALNLYQTQFRKPSYTVFCLDYSGSMGGQGEQQLEAALALLLDQAHATHYLINMGEDDHTMLIPFDDGQRTVLEVDGNDRKQLLDLLQKVKKETPDGSTDIYSPVIKGLNKIAAIDHTAYIPAVILMTDGVSNKGKTFRHLRNHWEKLGLDIPVFCILFGNASEKQLHQIVDLTRGRIFDGRHDLIKAFRKAKGYN